MSEESWALIEQRNELNTKMLGTHSTRIRVQLNEEYKEKDTEVKRHIRADKRNFINNIAEQAEEAAYHQNMRTLYALTKKLSNDAKHSISTAIEDKDGKLISGKTETTKRWNEHFKEILNREAPRKPIKDEETVNPEVEEISTEPPSIEEIKSAIKLLKNGKSAGIDSITAEMLKVDLDFSASKVKSLIEKIWNKEQIPKKWKKGIIIKLPKKGNLKKCKNWRGITLLPIVSKVLGRILINRIRDGIDHKLRKEQAGFRAGRGTVEQIFILRNIIEQTNEWQATLYLNFIDYEKAFDSIHRESLWKIMRSYGIPEKLTNIIKEFYKDFKCSVEDSGETSEWFDVLTGVKQGCNMSGFLFLLAMDWIMRRTTDENHTGIRWKFTSKLEDLDFADDIALLSSTKQHMQNKSEKIEEESERVGLKINIDKTKLMRINPKNNDPIIVRGQEIEGVEKIVYLGATITPEGGGMGDLKNRIIKARNTFTKLGKIWNSNKITRKTQTRLYKTLVTPVLLWDVKPG